MNPKTTLFFLLFLVIGGIVHAESTDKLPEAGAQAPEKREDLVKTRQSFNKLKRSTRNIYKVTMRSTVAFRLQTALGYISTIDLPEKALKVFVGDQELFKVEVYERQVLVKPITDEQDARTNLVIVTQSGRLAFDVTVGVPETADFVLDFRLPQDDELLVKNAFDEKVDQKVRELEKTYEEKKEKLDQSAEKLSEEKIKEKVATGVKTVELKKSEGKGDVQVNLLSLSQVGAKSYLRFSVLNYSKTPYKPLKAMIGMLTYEKKLLRNKEAGLIEIPSELQLPPVIKPDTYEYGVIAFDYRALGKAEKPVFRILEDAQGDGARNIEIKGFGWFE